MTTYDVDLYLTEDALTDLRGPYADRLLSFVGASTYIAGADAFTIIYEDAEQQKAVTHYIPRRLVLRARVERHG